MATNGTQFAPAGIDSTRPTGLSATEEETAAALELARTMQSTLTAEGWLEALLGMSGNGAYLLYRIDEPNDGETTGLITRVLLGFAQRFNNSAATVDCKTFNAARICKVLGTVARKGSDFCGEEGIEARPNRRSWFVEPSKPLQIIPRELLERVVVADKPQVNNLSRSKKAKPRKTEPQKPFDLRPVNGAEPVAEGDAHLTRNQSRCIAHFRQRTNRPSINHP